MVTVSEALTLIDNTTKTLSSETIEVTDACNRILAEDIYSPIHQPPFNNSAVDGFLVNAAWFTHSESKSFTIAGTIAAGDAVPPHVNPNESWRIMTGAIVPNQFDSVVMQEQVSVSDHTALFSQSVRKGQHIRLCGEDVSEGQHLFRPATPIKSAQIGLLLALGVKQIQVYRKPTVAIISTGSELVEAGHSIRFGQVYYCTGPMLASQLESFGAEVVRITRVADDLKATIEALNACENTDLVYLVGGMADGKFDFGRPALQQSGVEEIFYRGKWRPGKPLFFGKRGAQTIFGLPGNPVSCFVVNAIFGNACLRKMHGGSVQLPWSSGTLTHDYLNEKGPDLFLRARVDSRGALEVLPGQGSHELGTLAMSNALCHIPESSGLLAQGSVVNYILIS